MYKKDGYIYDYPRFKLTADIACIAPRIRGEAWPRILVVRRGIEPEKGKWELPGGNLNPDEMLIEAALRELREETGISVDNPKRVKQQWVLDALDRNPGERSISVLFSIRLSDEEVESVKIDHQEVLEYRFISPLLPDGDIEFAWDHGQVLHMIGLTIGYNDTGHDI